MNYYTIRGYSRCGFYDKIRTFFISIFKSFKTLNFKFFSSNLNYLYWRNRLCNFIQKIIRKIFYQPENSVTINNNSLSLNIAGLRYQRSMVRLHYRPQGKGLSSSPFLFLSMDRPGYPSWADNGSGHPSRIFYIKNNTCSFL